MTEEVRNRLRSWIAAQADLTLAELRSRLQQDCDLSVSVGRRQRAQWWEQMGGIEAERLIFLDESGVTTDMTRRYGRVVGGVLEGTPLDTGPPCLCWAQ